MMILCETYGAVLLSAAAILLWERYRVRGQNGLLRQDLLESLAGAATWPVLAVVYLVVRGNIWLVRSRH